MSKKGYTVHHEIIDFSTGELVRQEKRFTVATKGVDFYMVFNQSISFITKVTSARELHVLSKLCAEAEFNTGVCHLNEERRIAFAKDIGISPQNFRAYIFRLCKKGVIKNNRGTIEINPLCFWKGSTDERNKVINSIERKWWFEFNIKKEESPAEEKVEENPKP